MGWAEGEQSLASGFGHPFESFANMSQVLDKETWPPGEVKHIAYFRGPMQELDTIPAPFTDPDSPRRETERVKQEAILFLRANAGALSPLGTKPGSSTEVNWDLLSADGARKVEQRYPQLHAGQSTDR